MTASSKGASRFAPSAMLHCRTCRLRARAEINSHFAAGPQARWRGASDELYPVWYVRSEQQSQRACGPQPEGARRRRARIGFVAAPRRCPTSPASRRLASARPALAPKWEFISARALSLDKGSPNVKPRTAFFSRTPEESVFLPDINLTGHKPHRTVVRETVRRARP